MPSTNDDFGEVNPSNQKPNNEKASSYDLQLKVLRSEIVYDHNNVVLLRVKCGN
jgi:hypothetical protein